MSAPFPKPDRSTAPDLSVVHALLPSTRVETARGLVRADRSIVGDRLRTRDVMAALLDVSTVTPSPAACASRPTLRACTVDPGTIAPDLPRRAFQIAAGATVLVSLRSEGRDRLATVRGLDLAALDLARLGPAHRPVALRRLRLPQPDVIAAEGLWMPTGSLPDVPPLARAEIDALGADGVRAALRRANAAAVLRRICVGRPVAAA